MIDKESLRELIESKLEGSEYYLIDVYSEPGDRYVVEIDSDNGVDIDKCVELTRAVEEAFPREEDEEDYELEIGSAGLTTPFKVKRQYQKNIGQEVEVLTVDGRKLRGILAGADEEAFKLRYEVKQKTEGSKRPVIVEQEEEIPYSAAKQVKLDLQF